MPALKRNACALGVSLIALITALPATALAGVQAQTQGQDSSSSSAAAVAAKPVATSKKSDAAAKTTSDDITTVTITGQTPQVAHKIDRDVYDVKQDPTAATGSAADVLNNVPAVTVDPDGTVGLRGNSNVQVYVNGKKSTQMTGDNRGFTLQNLSGDDIDSVEVITTPTAEFGADAAGGIINIVMKRGRSIKPVTSVNAVVGDRGRGNINLRTGKTFGKLTINATASVNHGAGGDGGGGRGGRGGGFGSKSKNESDRFRIDPVTGAVVREDRQSSVSKSDNNSVSSNLNAKYNLNDNDTLESNFDYSANHRDGVRDSETLSYD
ncbi:MAG: hypothetical protein ACXU8U_04055, partial [Asticcacaulis sp.]